MTGPVTIAIPFTDRVDLTAPLVASLLDQRDDWHRLMLIDHGSTDSDTCDWVTRMHLVDGVEMVALDRIPTASLYSGWNLAISHAADDDGIAVILNNDITIPDRFIADLINPIRDHPVWWATHIDQQVDHTDSAPTGRITQTRGLARDGGLTGWAFAVAAGHWDQPGMRPIDEQLRFYSGDRDLVRLIRRAGGWQGRVDGLGVTHRSGATRRARPDLLAQQTADMALCRHIWR